MNRGSDVFTTWAWGLRRYAWVVLLFVVGIGVLVPAVQLQSTDVYKSQSQVGPVGPLQQQNFDFLPRLAQSVFTNGAVSDDVRKLLGLNANATVIPGTVQLTTAQDNPVMIIEGKASTPEAAQAIADAAASTLVLELNKYSESVGLFAVQHKALQPTHPAPKLVGGYLSIAVGLLAGVVAGIGAVGLILVVRRPVVDAAAAEATSGMPVLGTVRLPRGGGPPDAEDLQSIGVLSRRLLASGHDVVYLVGPVQAQVDQLTSSITEFMTVVGSTGPRPLDTGQQGVTIEPELHVPEVVALKPSSLEQWVRTPDLRSLTLLVVPQGIKAASLRRIVDEHTAGTPTALAVVALHRPRRKRTSSPSSPSSPSSEPEPPSSPRRSGDDTTKGVGVVQR